MQFAEKQKRVKISVVSAIILSLILIAVGASVDIFHVRHLSGLEGRLFLFASCVISPAIMLALPIVVLAYQRMHNEDAIDGQTRVTGAIEINLRVLQNTTEQVLLASLTWLMFALLAPAKFLGVLPVLAVYFAFARSLFWLGYHLGDNARGFGFASTFMPSVIILGYLAFRLLML